MFKFLSKLFKNQESSSLKYSQGTAPLQANSGITSEFNYQDAFGRLPYKFFNATPMFLIEAQRPNLAGSWIKRELTSNLSAYIFEYFPVAVKDSSGIALMSAAVYDEQNGIPHSFYVLIDRGHLVIRQIDETTRRTWALDLEPQQRDIESFVATLKNQCKPLDDVAPPVSLTDLIAEAMKEDEEKKARRQQQVASQLLSMVGDMLKEADRPKKH